MSPTVFGYGSLPKQYIAPQSHFIRLRDQRILRNRMRILRRKYKPLVYVTGVASVELECSQRNRISYIKDCDKCALVKSRILDMFQLLVFVTKTV